MCNLDDERSATVQRAVRARLPGPARIQTRCGGTDGPSCRRARRDLTARRSPQDWGAGQAITPGAAVARASPDLPRTPRLHARRVTLNDASAGAWSSPPGAGDPLVLFTSFRFACAHAQRLHTFVRCALCAVRSKVLTRQSQAAAAVRPTMIVRELAARSTARHRTCWRAVISC